MPRISTQQLGEAFHAASNFFPMPFEKGYLPDVSIEWTANRWDVCIGAVVMYCLFLYFGSMVMKDRKPFDFRLGLGAWNAFLSIFSFCGMCRTVPMLLGNILSQPYEQTICQSGFRTWGTGPSGFWVMLFIFSKIPELIDTVFIIIRKKPLIFLHWYHHITVLMFCWNSYSTVSATGLYFVAMNYTVHAMMYGYYCLQALNMCPKSFPAYLITASQIAQMFVGTGVCISAWYYKLAGHDCNNDITNLIAGGLMYGSYLYLFCEFAFKRYGPGKKQKKDKKIE